MGLKGNLSTTSMVDVFHTLRQGNSTGLLRVNIAEGPRFVELQSGAVSIAGRSSGHVLLGDLLVSRGLLDDARLEEALTIQKESGKLLGQVLLENSFILPEQLEEALRFQVEEEVCELFTFEKGDFDFLDGATLDARIAPGGGLVRVRLDLNGLLAEAAKRADEWKAIQERIPNQGFLFNVTPEGDNLLQSSEGLSPEGMIILRLVKTNRTVEAMVQKACLGRFNTNRMLIELWDAGIIAPAPMFTYEKVAREHLRMGRIDEARRVAYFASQYGDKAIKDKTAQLLIEVDKAQKPASTSSALNVKADPKLRSEVIRRNQPGLIIKKEKSKAPLVIVAIILLGIIGGGVWFMYFRGTQNEASKSLMQLDELSTKVTKLIGEEKFSEALQTLRDFKSFDDDTRQAVAELLDKKQKDIEARLVHVVDKFITARNGTDPAELKAAVDAFMKFDGLTFSSPQITSAYNTTRADVDAYLSGLASGEFDKKIKDLEATHKGVNTDALRKGYLELLASNPSERIASVLRDNVLALIEAEEEAKRALSWGQELRRATDVATSRAEFERAKKLVPGTQLAQQADNYLAELQQYVTDAQAQYEKLEQLINKPDEARPEIIKFLDAHPPYEWNMRGLTLLQGLGKTNETELQNGLKNAAAMYASQPAEARKRIVELVDKNPYSQAALYVTLKVRVTSVPDGATINVNGKPQGETPATVDVPATGFVKISVSKPGFKTLEAARTNLRDESFNFVLPRNVLASALQPVMADSGMCYASEQLIVVGNDAAGKTEAVFCSKMDLKALKRVKLGKLNFQNDGLPSPAPSVINGDLLVPNAAKGLVRVECSSGTVAQIGLEGIAQSSPLQIKNDELAAIATSSGFENFSLSSGKALKCTALGKEEKPSIGAATDGEHVYIPRTDKMIHTLVADTGLTKWNGNVGAAIIGTPGISPLYIPGAIEVVGKTLVAAATEDGKIIAFETQNGGEKWRQDLGGRAMFGVHGANTGFLVLTKDKANVVDRDGKIACSAALPGEPVIAPIWIRKAANETEKTFAVATKTADGITFVSLFSNSGAELFRIATPSAALGLATNGETLYVAIKDGRILAYDLR